MRRNRCFFSLFCVFSNKTFILIGINLLFKSRKTMFHKEQGHKKLLFFFEIRYYLSKIRAQNWNLLITIFPFLLLHNHLVTVNMKRYSKLVQSPSRKSKYIFHHLFSYLWKETYIFLLTHVFIMYVKFIFWQLVICTQM